jgi:hypothetical protein
MAQGRIAWVAETHPARGTWLLELFEKVDWEGDTKPALR